VNPDDFYTVTHPDYFETQKKDLWFYCRLWSVLLRQLERSTHARFLQEFGSGPGFLLKLAERRGWLAYGVEPSGRAREHAQDLGCLCGDTPLKNFDAAIATEVLEHVDDPYDTLRLWRAHLAPGGLLALSVPNDNNPLQRLLWGRSRPWVHHTHISYFNPRTLRLLVEEAGFMVIWQQTSFPVELLLILPIPRKWAWKLSRLWPAPPLLWRLHIGRHCLLVARKV
jgi:SAM-dependent methyltransferase